MAGKVFYATDYDICPGFYRVVFFSEKGEKLCKGFDSPYLCRKFVNKLRHSRRCTLVSYPAGI